MPKTIMDGVVERCEDAKANLSRAESELLQAAIPDFERDALYRWIIQLQGGCIGFANKAASIGLDLKGSCP